MIETEVGIAAGAGGKLVSRHGWIVKLGVGAIRRKRDLRILSIGRDGHSAKHVPKFFRGGNEGVIHKGFFRSGFLYTG
jgi:hypothetical protein